MPHDDVHMLTDRLPRTIAYPLGLSSCVTRVVECGEGDDHVVLLHGSGSRADRWRRNLPGLAAAGKHVYAFDFPGHGFATKAVDFEYSTPSFARVVGEALGELGIRRPVVVGTSLGGHVAAYLAVELRLPVRAVGLVGTTGIIPIEREVSTTVGRITNLSDAGVRDKLEFLMHDDTLVTDAWVREERRINSSPGAQEALARTAEYVARGTNDHLVGEQLAASGIPAIVFWGRDDAWIDVQIGRQIKATVLAKAPLVILRRAGHAPYYERPHVFNECLVTFLTTPEGYGSEVLEI
jgi:2-hydroxy-6-oxonona-2,4-dienedioate hydrolase